MLMILVLSSVYKNNFSNSNVLLNSDPYFNALYFCAAFSAPKSLLNNASILIFLISASCVLLNKKWAFRIYELVSSVLIWWLSIATMCLSSVDYSDSLLGCLICASLCYVPGAEYLCHRYLVYCQVFYIHLCCNVCELLHLWSYLIGIEFVDFCVSFLLSANKWHIKYVFDPLMGVI